MRLLIVCPHSAELISINSLYYERGRMSIFPLIRQRIFPAEEKRRLQKTRGFAIISAYIACPNLVGQDEHRLMLWQREPPVGARRSKGQPIHSFDAAGEESAEWRPLQRFEWSAAADIRPRAQRKRRFAIFFGEGCQHCRQCGWQHGAFRPIRMRLLLYFPPENQTGKKGRQP